MYIHRYPTDNACLYCISLFHSPLMTGKRAPCSLPTDFKLSCSKSSLPAAFAFLPQLLRRCILLSSESTLCNGQRRERVPGFLCTPLTNELILLLFFDDLLAEIPRNGPSKSLHQQFKANFGNGRVEATLFSATDMGQLGEDAQWRGGDRTLLISSRIKA